MKKLNWKSYTAIGIGIFVIGVLLLSCSKQEQECYPTTWQLTTYSATFCPPDWRIQTDSITGNLIPTDYCTAQLWAQQVEAAYWVGVQAQMGRVEAAPENTRHIEDIYLRWLLAHPPKCVY